MKDLLRGVFAAKPDDDRELLLRNFQHLRDSGLGFDSMEDTAAWERIKDFVSAHHHVPDISTVREYFSVYGEKDVVDRLDVVAATTVRYQGDYKKLIEAQVREANTRKLQELLRNAATIVKVGMTVKDHRGKETKLQGPVDAIKHLWEQGQAIVMPSTGNRLSGNVITDGASYKQEYERVENDPLAGIGQFVGLGQMDEALGGAKRGELWTHAAFTGGLKSTLALNWVYNQAIYYGHSSVFFSLEMPYDQVRRIIMAIHSHHHKFAEVRKRLGLGNSLDYSRMRDGQLDHYTAEQVARMPEEQVKRLLPDHEGLPRINPDRPERKFLYEHVLRDLDDPRNMYGGIHIEVADPDKSDFTVDDLRSRAEMIYSNDPNVSLIVADHAGLMAPRHRHNSTTENLNEVIRDLKRTAMSFNRGAGIAVVALFQISREGYKSAEKNEGRYNLTHLSYANEAERSSDIVTASWVDDDLRSRNQVRFQCLKSRDNRPFDTFYARVYWPCRRMLTLRDVPTGEAKKAGDLLDAL